MLLNGAIMFFSLLWLVTIQGPVQTVHAFCMFIGYDCDVLTDFLRMTSLPNELYAHEIRAERDINVKRFLK